METAQRYSGYVPIYPAIGVVTLSQRRLQEKEGRLRKLAAGLVMLDLGGNLQVPR